MAAQQPRSVWSRAAPGLALMVLAPVMAEVVPGATRLSAIYVLPIEIMVWGGGALMIHALINKLKLGWLNMLLLALALAVAEEFLIQQTSTAPLVIQLKGQEYARFADVNFVYFLWAAAYEAVLVVFVPIQLVRLLFPQRRGPWLGPRSAVVVGALFLLGSCFAWFTWTQIAREQVFHVAKYDPPPSLVAAAGVAIVLLLLLALGPFRRAIASAFSLPWRPPSAWLLGAGAAAWAVVWFGLELLAFGAMPEFPSPAAVGLGLAVLIAIVHFLPHWHAHHAWSEAHGYALVVGATMGMAAVMFFAFQGAAPLDLYGKIVIDLIALALLVALGFAVARRIRPASPAATPA